MNKKKGFLLNL